MPGGGGPGQTKNRRGMRGEAPIAPPRRTAPLTSRSPPSASRISPPKSDAIRIGSGMAAAPGKSVEALELDQVEHAKHDNEGGNGQQRRMDHDFRLSARKKNSIGALIACVEGVGEPKRQLSGRFDHKKRFSFPLRKGQPAHFRRIVPLRSTASATVFEMVPNLRTFLCSSSSRWSVSSVSTMISYVTEVILGGASWRSPWRRTSTPQRLNFSSGVTRS